MPITVDIDAAQYQPRVRFQPPAADNAIPVTVDATSSPRGLSATLSDTGTSGIYEAELSTTDDKQEDRFFAVNVQADEGDLAVCSRDTSDDPFAGRSFRVPIGRATYRSRATVGGVEPQRLDPVLARRRPGWRTVIGLRGQLPPESRKGGAWMTTYLPLAVGDLRTTFEWGSRETASDWLLPLAGHWPRW